MRPQPLHPVPTDLNQLVRETMILARDDAVDARIAFVLELAERLPPIEADPGRIKQVLLNIVVNGIQSIAGNGEIRIRTAIDRPGRVGLSVADHGAGIPAEIRERIFDPFFSTKATGTGLGMAIARRIVEGHNGTIEIDSEEGRGTTVTVFFPAQEAEGEGR